MNEKNLLTTIKAIFLFVLSVMLGIVYGTVKIIKKLKVKKWKKEREINKVKQFRDISWIITMICGLSLVAISIYVGLFLDTEEEMARLPLIEQIFYPYLAVFGIIMLIIIMLTLKELKKE